TPASCFSFKTSVNGLFLRPFVCYTSFSATTLIVTFEGRGSIRLFATMSELRGMPAALAIPHNKLAPCAKNHSSRSADCEQHGGGEALTTGPHGLHPVTQAPALLQAQRLHGRQHPRDESTARRAGAAERAAPPQHRRAPGTLGRVVGRLDAL